MFFFFSSRRRHTRSDRDWSSDVCSSDLQNRNTPTGVALMAVFAGANAVAGVFLFWTPTFLKEKFHFELTMAGLSGAVYIHLASALSVPVAGVVADRLARRLAGGRILAQGAGLLVGAGFIDLVGLTDSVNVLILA